MKLPTPAAATVTNGKVYRGNGRVKFKLVRTDTSEPPKTRRYTNSYKVNQYR